eukprot:CAMPEP_0176184790 /NCGR_PEP_ID=MMETSP0121_2-20121125/1005_1 /TAXON_ID=160619 /ORGANISM="Kryptoperidinium foliaceum, Strain CCMP 1326" /LENGTH=224 /DNA_ID=CAMNT_0017523193 /DNA_START=36 /DNA_END=706 /DNA_ORIENTATION=+
MTCPAAVFTEALTTLTTRLSQVKNSTPSALSELEDLLLRLNEQYPGDIGVFSPLMTNYVRLEPGQSFFIGANELHAYISGECVECMALSDNVVRAGLTPKLKDCDTLCRMLVYKSRLPSFLSPQKLDAYTSLYRPPADCCAEFEVEIIELPPNTQKYEPVKVNCGSILLLCQSGTGAGSTMIECEGPGQVLKEGAVVFTGAGETVHITTGQDSAVFYRAHVNLG